jgi:hypothetical protein
MVMLTRKALILAKTETTEGTDASPVAGSDALLVSNPVPSINAEEISRDIIVSHLSPLGSVPGIRSAQITFTTELRGLGAGTLPTASAPLREDPLWQACGFAASYATSSAVYAPDSNPAGVTTCTIYAYLDGILQVMKGCRGNVEIVAEAGNYGRLNWTMQGVFDALSSSTAAGDIRDAAIPGSPSFQAFSLKPPPVLSASLTVHGVSTLVAQAININMNNDIQQRVDMSAANGIASFVLVNRNPQGTLNPEAFTRNALDVWYKWQESAEAAVQFIAGTASGNRVTVDAPATQFGSPTWGDRNGIRTYELPLRYNASADAGDDEITATWD